MYFQSIVQGFHCAVHRKHSGIHEAETSYMLFENFSGIIFFQNNFSADEDILQLQLHHN